MRMLYTAAATYLGLGLAAGVFYREFTRWFGVVDGDTQLNTLHTHLLALGMLFFLVALALDAAFGISEHRRFRLWFILHNVAMAWTIGFMLANGVVHVTGHGDAWTAMWSGLAGMGHILLTVSFVLFFTILSKRIRVTQARRARAAAGSGTPGPAR